MDCCSDPKNYDHFIVLYAKCVKRQSHASKIRDEENSIYLPTFPSIPRLFLFYIDTGFVSTVSSSLHQSAIMQTHSILSIPTQKKKKSKVTKNEDDPSVSRGNHL